MTIQQLVSKLESQITIQLNELSQMGKKAQKLQQEADEQYAKMAILWANELKPAEIFIRTQNPQLCELFDSLEKIYTTPKETAFDLGMVIGNYDKKD